jgi:hypothetical protein
MWVGVRHPSDAPDSPIRLCVLRVDREYMLVFVCVLLCVAFVLWRGWQSAGRIVGRMGVGGCVLRDQRFVCVF